MLSVVTGYRAILGADSALVVECRALWQKRPVILRSLQPPHAANTSLLFQKKAPVIEYIFGLYCLISFGFSLISIFLILAPP